MTVMGEFLTLDEALFAHVAAAIRHVRGNMTAAADLLGVDRRTLYRYCKTSEIVRAARAEFPHRYAWNPGPSRAELQAEVARLKAELAKSA